MGGNYLLNIGPKSDGTVVAYEQDVLKGIGAWTKIHEEAIFNTEVNPFKKLPWGYSSVRTATKQLYLHVFDWPKNGELVIPGFQNKIKNAYHLSDPNKNSLLVNKKGFDKMITIGETATNKNLSVVVIEYEGELSIVDPVIAPIKNGTILLKDELATKHGKYGMLSYRSIIKDDIRTWDMFIEDAGTYEVQLIYKMKYEQKDFKIKVGDSSLDFSLSGKAPEKAAVEELFDGNETYSKVKQLQHKKFGKATVGLIKLKKGKQTLLFTSGKEFEFKASLKEFHAQDRSYRGLNTEVKVIKLVKK